MLSMTASCAVPVTACIKYVGAGGGRRRGRRVFRCALTTFPGTSGEGAARPMTSAHHFFLFAS